MSKATNKKLPANEQGFKDALAEAHAWLNGEVDEAPLGFILVGVTKTGLRQMYCSTGELADRDVQFYGHLGVEIRKAVEKVVNDPLARLGAMRRAIENGADPAQWDEQDRADDDDDDDGCPNCERRDECPNVGHPEVHILEYLAQLAADDGDDDGPPRYV